MPPPAPMPDPTPPDPTPPRPAGHALAQSDGFQLLAHALPDAVLAVEPGGTVVYASAPAKAFLGRSPQALVGTQFLDLVWADDRAAFPSDLFSKAVGAWDVRPAHDPGQWLSVAVLAPDADARRRSALGRALGDAALVLVRDVPEHDAVVRDRTDLLRHALDAADHIVVVSDPRAPDSPLVFVNRNFCRVTGYTRGEVVGRNCRFLQVRADGTRDDDQDGVREIRRAVAAGEPTRVVIRNYRRSGEMFYNELFLTPIRDAHGEVVNYVGVQNDVTERVRAERQAESQAGLLQAFYDSAPLLMGVVERQAGRVVHKTANARAVEFYDVAADDVAGRSPEELGFTEPEADRWDEAVEESAATGDPVAFNTAFPWGADEGGDGVRSLRMTVSPVGIDDLFSYVGEDVTEARRAARERRLLAAAVENAAEAIVITDAGADGEGPRIVYANRAHERVFGYPAGEVLGRSPRMFQGTDSDRAVLDRVGRRLRAGVPVAGEVVNYRRDGTPFLLEWEMAPVADDDGTVSHWVATQRDVTDRRRLEHEVLEAAGREQERMARELHDGLGQVLTGAAMQLYVVERTLTADDAPAAAGLAADVGRIRGHVADALNQARAIAHGLFPVEVEPDGLADALRQLCVEAGEAFGVACSFAADGPVAVATSERAGHLYRVVQEALTNAVRHGQAGRVAVTLEADGDEAVLTVRDDGAGISDDALEGGAGLGLRTMAYRARRVGGALDVQALDGGGTAVRVRFPVVR